MRKGFQNIFNLQKIFIDTHKILWCNTIVLNGYVVILQAEFMFDAYRNESMFDAYRNLFIFHCFQKKTIFLSLFWPLSLTCQKEVKKAREKLSESEKAIQ